MNRHQLLGLGGGTPSGLLSQRAAWMPDSVALLFEDERWTYRSMDETASRIAGGLLALGVSPGDRVAMFLSNRSEYLTLGFGANRAGAVSVPINTTFKAEFLRSPIERTRVGVVFTEAALSDTLCALGALPPAVKTLVYVDQIPEHVPAGVDRVMSLTELEELGRGADTFPDVQPGDINGILFTSGTTGRSKGVLCPNLMALTMAKEHVDVMEITPRDRMLTCFPMYHGMAQVVTCLAAICAGATAVVRPGFSVSTFWDEVRAYQATQFNALGVVLHLLLSAPESDRDREHEVTRVFSAPAPPDALYRFEARFGVHLIEGYGQTETKNILYNPWHKRRIGSMGIPTPSSIVEIHDAEGNRVPPGGVGEIVYRPKVAHVMNAGYLDDEVATLAASQGLWWHTGDMGSADEDGYFYFFDRTTDSLRRRGENISSTDVEEILTSHPGVALAAAVRADSELGEHEVLAVVSVVDAASFDPAELWQFCVDHMPRFMVPRYIRVVDVMPFTATGKVRKSDLRADGLGPGTWDAEAEGYTVPRR